MPVGNPDERTDTMKKTLGILGISLLAAAPVQAQSQAGTVNASATVQAFLAVSNQSDLAFGTIAAGGSASVLPGAAPGAGQTLGSLRVDHNSDVSVSVTVPAGLSMGAAPVLPVTFSCGWSLSPTGALIGSAAACNSLPNRVGLGTGAAGTTYLQVGGSISSASTTNRLPGTYTGSLTFTIAAQY